ncbi:MAG: hypothetical protein AAF321_03905 [Pseudomonadota bacterium]
MRAIMAPVMAPVTVRRPIGTLRLAGILLCLVLGAGLLVASVVSQPRQSARASLTLVASEGPIGGRDVLTLARSPAVIDRVSRRHAFSEPYARRAWRWLRGRPEPTVEAVLIARTKLRLRSVNGSHWSLEVLAHDWTASEAERLAEAYVSAIARMAVLRGLAPRETWETRLADALPPAGTLPIASFAEVLPPAGRLTGRPRAVALSLVSSTDRADRGPAGQVNARSVSLGATLLGFLALTFGVLQVGRRGFAPAILDPETVRAATGCEAIALDAGGGGAMDGALAQPDRAACQFLLDAAMRGWPRGQGGVIAVTALSEGAGPTIARRLAVLAHRVDGAALFVDADLEATARRSRAPEGLADILQRGAEWRDMLRVPSRGPAALPAGRATLRPALLFAMPYFSALFEEVRTRFAATVLVAPPIGSPALRPVLAGADTVIIAAGRTTSADYLADRAERVSRLAPRARVLIALL